MKPWFSHSGWYRFGEQVIPNPFLHKRVSENGVIPGSIIDFRQESTFTGYGPTDALELRRSGGFLTPFLRLRAAVLYRDLEREDLLSGNQTGDWELGLETCYEIKFALESRKTVGCGQWFSGQVWKPTTHHCWAR